MTRLATFSSASPRGASATTAAPTTRPSSGEGGWEHRGCGCHGIAHLPGVTSVRADLGRKVSCNAVHWQRRPQRHHQAVRETLLQPWQCTEVGQGAVVAQPGLPAAGCGQCCLPSLPVVQSPQLVRILLYSNCQARHAAPCSEGCAKLFMMPLSAKKRAQNQVGAASRCLICRRVRVDAGMRARWLCRCNNRVPNPAEPG